MSFLDKLGDFGGGFAEGAAEAFQPAFERGWESATERIDLAEKREYQKGLLGEERERTDNLRHLGQLTQNRDLQGLSEAFPEGDPLYEEALSNSQVIIADLKQNADKSLRMADVAIDRFSDLASLNYKQWETNGIDYQGVQQHVLALLKAKENIESVMNEPNFDWSVTAENRASYDEQLKAVDDMLIDLNNRDAGYITYLKGKEDYLASIKIAETSQDWVGLNDLLYNQGGKYLSPRMTQAKIKESLAARIKIKIANGDLAGAAELAEGDLSLMQGVADAEKITEGKFTAIDIATTNTFGGLSSLYEGIINNPDLFETERDQMIRAVSNKFEDMFIKSIKDVAIAVKEASRGVSDYIIDPETGGHIYATAAQKRNVGIDLVLKNPTSYGLEPWMAERYEWDMALENFYGQSTADNLYSRVAKQYNDLIHSGVYSKEEVLGMLDGIDWMSPLEKNKTTNMIQSFSMETATKSAKEGLSGPLRNFTLLDIPGFSQLDELQIKSMAKDAAAVPQSKRNTLLTDILKDIDNAITNPENREKAKARVTDLFQDLSPTYDIYEEEMKKADALSQASQSQGGAATQRRQLAGRSSAGPAGGGNSTRDRAMGFLQGQPSKPPNIQGVSTLTGGAG